MKKAKSRLLIVDDQELNIQALTNILGEMYILDTAKSGVEAIETVTKDLPDLILMDVVMPDMTGFEIITMLKNNPRTAPIPVIFITGLTNAKDEERGLELGAADYINKPFSPSVVKLRVRNQLLMLEMISDIEYLSMTDQLTGIPNRRAFDRHMETEWKRAFREKIPLSFMVIDIDHFKKHNDTYGHQQGDETLKLVATTIKQIAKRSGDFAARWGGEEFVVLLQNTNLDGAETVAEKLRATIEELDVQLIDGGSCTVTISLGVNTLIPSNESSIASFVAGADEALYDAKKSGRNRVCKFGAGVKTWQLGF